MDILSYEMSDLLSFNVKLFLEKKFIQAFIFGFNASQKQQSFVLRTIIENWKNIFQGYMRQREVMEIQ